ncbi:MAG: general secretion pathway protein GspB [Thiogranum sp.]|jgi:MSHA biogenesis protein MshK|nr:general secretion pathway protein GspB [Thiogranum sp.]
MVKRLLPALLLITVMATMNASALQDPTRPMDPALYFGNRHSGGTSDWALQSILSSAERRIAVINGTRVREGDRIGTARVVSIRPSHVVLNTGKRTLTLQLWPEPIRKMNP